MRTIEEMLGLGTLRRVAGEVRRDLAAARARDPAATGVSPAEILAAWPGVHALLSHRVAHALRGAGVPVAPRALAYVSRSLTGIEIHPAARIADGFLQVDLASADFVRVRASRRDDCPDCGAG